MSVLTEQDIAAARAQGDLVSLLLMESGIPVAAAAPKQRSRAAVPMMPRSRPGAWPDGSRSPGLTAENAAALNLLWPGRFTADQS